MATLVKSYVDGKEKIELTFKGEKLDYTMLPVDGGRKGDKPAFDTQVVKKYPELAEDEDVLDLVDRISFESDADDILEILEELTDLGY